MYVSKSSCTAPLSAQNLLLMTATHATPQIEDFGKVDNANSEGAAAVHGAPAAALAKPDPS